MRIIARSTLANYCQRHRETEKPLRDWLSVTQRAEWSDMQDVKSIFGKASVIDPERVCR